MEMNELKEKVEFYLTNKISVHIETYSNRFYNGLVLECSNKHLLLLDKVLGKIYITFSEIIILEKNKWMKEKGNDMPKV